MVNRNWRLPEGVDELLPPAAWRLEQVRRKVLDVFRAWGFDFVEPPIIEYLDSLLAVGSDDIDLQTLKAVDQRTGRMLGVRADLTSQAVRMDAHSLRTDGVQRLCYAGTVVLANPPGVLDSRVPLKAGAEIFGSTSLAADVEMIALLVEVLRVAGIRAPLLVLGHMGIYRSLVAELNLNAQQQAALFSAVQSKSESDIAGLLGADPGAALLQRLPGLMGDRRILDEAAGLFAASDVAAGSAALAAIEQLRLVADMVAGRCPEVSVRFDLAELAGYGYHNGPVFSAFHADHGRALARGGRYDGIGAAYGCSRPATGFDVSLKELVQRQPEAAHAVWVPWHEPGANEPQELRAQRAHKIRQLRADGEVVIMAVAADERVPTNCSRQLALDNAMWVVSGLKQTDLKEI